MSVRVTTTATFGNAGESRLFAEAKYFDVAESGHLHVVGDKRHVATFAPYAWASAENVADPEPMVNAAARDDYPEAAKYPSVTLAPAEAVLSETTEPFVSVSVTANDADELLKVLRKALRAGKLPEVVTK